MRNVSRPVAPESLRKNGAAWTRELMHALEAPNPDKGQLRTLFNRYSKDDVRYALAKMYSDRCCGMCVVK